MHDQLNTFIGITFNQDDRFWIIWASSVRCEMSDVLFNEDFKLTKDFSDSFLRDIVWVSAFCALCFNSLGSSIPARIVSNPARRHKHAHDTRHAVLVGAAE